jgi:hypothetical protein
MMQPNSYPPPEDGLSPQDVRILSLRAEAWPENDQRVRVHLMVTPFLERPNFELSIHDGSGIEYASIYIIESIDATMTFTMHLRGEQIPSTLALSAQVSYPDHGIVDQKSEEFVR